MDGLARLATVILIALATACTSREPAPTPASQPPVNEQHWQGVLPGSDCDEVLMTLVFNLDDHTYQMRETTAPGSDCDTERDYIGRWQIVRGNDNKPDAVIYQLDYDRPETLRNFLLIDNDQLKLVDERGNEFWMPFNLVLERVSGGK